MGRGCTRERASETRSRKGTAEEVGRNKEKPRGAGLGLLRQGRVWVILSPVRQKITNGVGFKLTEGDKVEGCKSKTQRH